MREPQSDTPRIHVLGVGNLGRLFAHALANSPNPPPISLLLHRSSLLEEWEQAGRKITITTNGVVNSIGQFDVEEITSASAPSTPVSNLVLATKTINTLSALRSISHRLNSNSTVLFAQNGMGTIDETDSQVFTNNSTRPNYLTCITSHGVFDTGPFSSVHAGQASISIGRSLQRPPPTSPSTAQYLIDKVLEALILAAKEYPSEELLFLQLEKLVINAIINPLTAILSCRNGELLDKGPIVKVMRLLLQETAQVIQLLPEISSSDDPSVADRFSTQKLEVKVLDVAEKTSKNTSSMLQDVRAGRQTEIEYINGWIVKKGREQGVECEHNAKLVEMVKGAKKIGIDELRDLFAGPGGTFGVADAIVDVVKP
ncbi:Ketoisovalerate reductase BEA2 [Hyphodiscus hymeniophilus]|uniref:2-dehydropantoate 2-reductase n=1 Tax=Hyphodiscus hymeniophilus TaxID=353542 RepID=A0A9P6VG19_9HELO|nr:Ketoisovalerate reductase BEA2 [Hyphodiscus hymeniophilus]